MTVMMVAVSSSETSVSIYQLSSYLLPWELLISPTFILFVRHLKFVFMYSNATLSFNVLIFLTITVLFGI
jgi:hypothetical protein